MTTIRKRKKTRDDTLGPVWICVFLALLVVGPIYQFLGPLFWVLLGIVVVSAVLAGINWLFNRDRF